MTQPNFVAGYVDSEGKEEPLYLLLRRSQVCHKIINGKTIPG